MKGEANILNEMQKQAIYTLDEKVLVVAGAGTGKTTVLTERIMFLLRLGIDAKNIYAFTGGKGEQADKLAAFCALSLYLDFLNIFMALLRILGSNRE